MIDMHTRAQKLILWFDEISHDDVGLVGGKNASLGEMYSSLASKGIPVPKGFAVTAEAYRKFVSESGLDAIIRRELVGIDTRNIRSLQKKGKKIRAAFLKADLPADLVSDIREAYRMLGVLYRSRAVDVAVRSSATAEDLPGASFAGEHETFLNVRGADDVIAAVRKSFASLFTDRAISYRVDKGFDHFDVALSVAVQKMVRSDKGSSGVMFTLDTESGYRQVVQIEAAWGLGEIVVGGRVTPDEFLVFKPALEKNYDPIIKKRLGAKTRKVVYGASASRPIATVRTSQKERERYSLTDAEALTLARWAVVIERHYAKKFRRAVPMDIEWAKDGVSGKLFIVQARPETVQSEKSGYATTVYTLREKGAVVTKGISVGSAIVSGRARVILSAKFLREFREGEILVARITDPDWEPVMKKAKAIITEKGGRTSHAAIVSRELGIPAIVGAEGALSKIRTGDMLTVDSASDASGVVYAGKVKFESEVVNFKKLPETRTKLALNIGSPDNAFRYAHLPHAGVGLAREEFIIASHIGIHPKALLDFKKLEDKKTKAEIEKRTAGYKDKKEFFLEKLSRGIAHIGAAFWPRDVIVRFSDFKTNEYRTLLGGHLYEPEEENPMLGWRGAARFVHADFTDAFALECAAIRRVREKMGMKNVHVMVPFCRTPDEGKKVVALMKKSGLEKGARGLKVYVMCEIPSNVLRANEFLDVFDGFSIGSNDLTQLALGMDRDSEIIAGISDENDPAVRKLVADAVAACKKRGKYVGFCGQAPSDHPDFLRFLVSEGVDVISLNPDSFVSSVSEVVRAEKRLRKK